MKLVIFWLQVVDALHVTDKNDFGTAWNETTLFTAF